MKNNLARASLLILSTAALLSSAAFATSNVAVTADYGVASIAWETNDTFTRGTLTVAGPTGIVRVSHFSGEEDLVFDLVNQNGQFLGDGDYTYELITHGSGDDENARNRTTGFFSVRGGILKALTDGTTPVDSVQPDSNLNDGLVASVERVFDVAGSFSVESFLGIGTDLPLFPVHIAFTSKVVVRLENLTTGHAYDLGHTDAGFGLSYDPSGSVGASRIFGIQNDSHEDALFIANSGRIGLNSNTPSALLEVNRCADCPNAPFLRLNGGTQVAGAPTRLTIESADTSMGVASAQLHFIDQAAAKSATFEYRVLSGVPTFALNFVGTGNQDFRLDDTGAFRVGRGNTTTFEVLSNGTALATSFVPTSARASKNHFRTISNQSVLDQVNRLDIARWSYLSDQDSDHIGPVAEDFFEAFGLGNTDKGINLLDATGVSMAAIQGLTERLEDRNATIDTLEERIARLEALILQANEQ